MFSCNLVTLIAYLIPLIVSQEQNSPSITSIDTDSRTSAKSSCPSSKSSRRPTIRSSSSSTFRTQSHDNLVPQSEYRSGGFFLTYPINNCNQNYSKGMTDIGKAVSEIRNCLRISESNFKFMPKETRQLYERTTINWNIMSGLKST